MSVQSLINTTQRIFSRSRLLVYLSVKARNQANRIIGYSLAMTHDPNKNGEEQIIRQIADHLQVIVDVGANKGEWTLLAKKYTSSDARFYLIEPGIAANKVLQSQVTENTSVHQLGLSDANGELNFFEEENAGEQSSFIISNYHRQYKTIKVQVESLDHFCMQNEISVIDLLKIDCEGYDYKVLLGAGGLLKDNKIKYIQFEYGSGWRIAGGSLKAAINFLNQFGYKTWSISPNGLLPFDVDFYGEYFEYSNFFSAKKLPEGLGIQL